MLKDVISSVKPLDLAAMEKCQVRLDNLTKPLNSLYSFEHLALKLAGITATPRPQNLSKSIILMAGDHGIRTDIEADCLHEDTADLVAGFINGTVAINVAAEHVTARLCLVDIGIAVDLPPAPQVCRKKIAYGTKNIAREAAMTREQALRAINTGIEIAREEIKKGARILGLGEVGAAAAIPSIAMIACHSTKELAALAGTTPGLSAEFLSKRIRLIENALTVNRPERTCPLDVLSKLGGLEIAGMVGVILGAAAARAAIVLDGLASSAAALIAVQMAPIVKDYLIGSHFSPEPAHKVALDLIGVPAHLHLEVGLGEGVGAALGMMLVNASLHVLNDMKTFGEAEVAVAQDGPGALKQSQSIKD